jgi:hypothetical protein
MSSPHLSAVFEHPLKSGRGHSVAGARVEPEGLAFDRRFLAHTPDGTFLSGRSHPRLVTITAAWDGTTLALSAPGREPLVLEPRTGAEASVAVWKDRFPAWDQGDGPARWLSEVLDDEVRLAWLGESRRVLRWDWDRRVTFADAAPLLLLGQASVADLSARVGEDLSVRRFRPNLVVAGAEPYEEDHWRRIRIGGVEFLNLDGCGRCEFTTIDPDTGERHPRGEPVATLESYRKADTGIYFGMNLMPLTRGEVRVGDPVTILERRQPLVFGTGAGFVPAPGPADPPWPGEAAPLRCTAVRDQAPGVRTYSLVREDGRPFGWRAGQYLTLRFDLPTGTVRRSYTLSSAPGTSGAEITVKRIPGGLVSDWIHDHLVPGCSVTAEAVGGSFTLEDRPWPTYLFLGAGSGVTPLVALVRHITDRDLPVTVAFHQSARTRADLLFTEDLERYRRVLGDRLALGERITSEEGRLDHQGLVKFCPDLRDRRAFVCGPTEYRASVRGLLAGAGFKVDRRYHEELFGEAALEVPGDAVPGMVRFLRTGKTVPSDGRTTVLQLAERSGVNLASSCRSGDCGTCRVQTGAGDWVLACHTFPRGDVDVLL